MLRSKMLSLFLMVPALGFAGCKQPMSDNDAILVAIKSHLAARGNLNTAAFDMEIQKVSIQGDQAQADVAFHVKDGPGMMQLSYTLKKAGGNWAVVESNPVGSNFTHPVLDGTGSAAPGLPPSGPAPDILDAIHERVRTLSPVHPATSPGQPK